jgi:hypothetical protein
MAGLVGVDESGLGFEVTAASGAGRELQAAVGGLFGAEFSPSRRAGTVGAQGRPFDFDHRKHDGKVVGATQSECGDVGLF